MSGDVVAIDGPAGAGKSTVARKVAGELGVAHIDTGAMYRLAGCQALGAGVDLDDPRAVSVVAEQMVSRCDIDPEGGLRYEGKVVGEEIRSPEVSHAASVVAAHPQVRRILVRRQRALVPSAGAVVEGRDIGTVVWPQARVKVYLDASPDIRAVRRSADAPGLSDVTGAIAERDRRDASRRAGPMRPARDAVLIDTSELDADQVAARVLALVRAPDPKRPDLLYRALRLVFGALLRGPFRISVTGREHLPSRGPAILAPNHRSLIDHFVVGTITERKVWFMGKEELFRSSLGASVLGRLGAFPVRRGRPDRAALQRSLDLLAAGELLGIYPEGTRRPDSRFEEVEEGFAYIALKSGAPIVPVALSGTEAVFPKGRRLPRFVKIHVAIGAAFALGGPHDGVLPRRVIREATGVAHRRLSAVMDGLEPR